jgi:hypothetical protein
MAGNANSHKLTGPGPGRPKGSKNRATKAKEDYFKAYSKIGGMACLIEILSDKRSRKEFLLRVLPSLMPKNGDDKTKIEIEYGLRPELEALVKALLEARRTIDTTAGQRSAPKLEYRA